MEKHHIVPRFLGGSDSEYNMEIISIKEHYIKHLIWARQLNTASAWMAVNAIMNRNKNIGLFRSHWRKLYGNSIKGRNNPQYGVKKPTGKDSPNWKGGFPNCISCEKQLSRRNSNRCRSCDITIKNKNRNYTTFGSNNGRAVITEENALHIIELSKTNGPAEICKITGFTYQVVYKVINKTTWKYLQRN